MSVRLWGVNHPFLRWSRVVAGLLVWAAVITTPVQAAPVKIMCVGDSLTDTTPGYRGFLYDQLKSEGYDFEFVGPKKGPSIDGGALDHAGFGGYSIGPGPSKADEWSNGKGNIMANVESIMKSDPDLVLLLIGTNEFFTIGALQPEHNADRDGPNRLAALVDRIHELKPEVKVLVGSVMPVAWTAEFAKGFNSALPGLLKDKRNTWFVDTAKLAGFETGDWSGDGLHPSESGYRKLAGVWFHALKEHLTANDSIKTAYLEARAKAEASLAEEKQKQQAQDAAMSKRVRQGVVPIADFVKQKPSYAYLSWEPLENSGAATADGWKVNAVPDGGFGVYFPETVDLSGATHLVVTLRRDEGGNSDVFIKLLCSDGERLFKIAGGLVSSDMKEVVLPIGQSEGKGGLALVKQVQIQGNFNKSQKFAYTIKSIEAEKIEARP